MADTSELEKLVSRLARAGRLEAETGVNHDIVSETGRVVLDANDMRQAATALEGLMGENSELRLAICGGEDAPGYADSLTHNEVLKVLADNYGSWKQASEAAHHFRDEDWPLALRRLNHTEPGPDQGVAVVGCDDLAFALERLAHFASVAMGNAVEVCRLEARATAAEAVVKAWEQFGRKMLAADREALADHRPKGGVADAIDNSGTAYQSQWFADALKDARALLSRSPEQGGRDQVPDVGNMIASGADIARTEPHSSVLTDSPCKSEDEFRHWYEIVRAWSGSAFLSGEKVEDEPALKSALYSDLCRLGNYLDGWADEAAGPGTSDGQRKSEETGWLIEAWSSRTSEYKSRWWSLGGENGFWSADSLDAVRFAREADAQAYIDNIGWTEAKPTEHAWVSK